MELVARMVDITTLPVDAIVNAANEMLAPGGGVCGAIHAKAGPELAAACAVLAGCPTGQARITPGFRLPARYVIHAVVSRGSLRQVIFACFTSDVLQAYRDEGIGG